MTDTPTDTPGTRRPIVALGDGVVFPGAVTTVELHRPENLRALEALASSEGLCLVVPLRTPTGQAPYPPLEPRDLRAIGTLARAVRSFRLPDRGMRVVLRGLRRVRLHDVERAEGFLDAEALFAEPSDETTHGAETLVGQLLAGLRTIAAANPRYAGELPDALEKHRDDPGRAADLAAAGLPLSYDERVRLLAELDPCERLARIGRVVEEEVIRTNVGRAVDDKVAQRIRRDYLRERIAALREELDEQDPHAEEADRLEERIEATPLSNAARSAVLQELALFRRVSPAASDAASIRNYIEWILQLPWRPRGERPRLANRFGPVVRHLNRSHVGLEDVKRRISEFLAVRQLGGGSRGTVLCFIGPPGTGKSSMGRTVAEALKRPVVTIPVGGMTKEWEIAGIPHRHKSGAPGAILTGLQRSGADDPVILLDEIDKLRLGLEGESSGALLQLLDPEHNAEFLDHYLGFPFDVSRCLFLATANDSEEIPDALLDRMEVIDFCGYTDSEKVTIARRHLLPKAFEHASLEPGELRLSHGALRCIIRQYTEEAGVRQLQRVLVSLARKAAVQLIRTGKGLDLRMADVERWLGPPTIDEELRLRRPAVGVAVGLAWTSAGGSLLPIEALVMAGSGNVTLTGQVGDMLRESVQTAMSYLRTRLHSLGFERDSFNSLDFHLHFPSGGIPKDGPSAGVAIATALVSLFSGRPARHDIAMTGEVSLLGSILPVGGIREKLLAAIRNGITEVIVPAGNEAEVRRLPAEIRDRLVIHPIHGVREAFGLALLRTRRRRRGALFTTSTRGKSARRARGRDDGGAEAAPGA